jgi:Uma2 family endonuclease
MIQQAVRADVIYPESDGEPMAENTRQFEAIVTVKGNLDIVFHHEGNVFVAGDLFWYPVEGDNTIRRAPDVLVAFGRPKGHRGSYRQWEEQGIAPQVVFEIWSRSNRFGQMMETFHFYERYGVEEYYIYDPEEDSWEGWQRQGEHLQQIAKMNGWVSPRLRVRFAIAEGRWQLYRPDGQKFASFVELELLRDEERQHAELERLAREQAQQRADQERLAREQAQQRADQERLAREQAQQRAEQERLAREQAQQRADQERLAREQTQQQMERLTKKLRDLGVDPSKL